MDNKAFIVLNFNNQEVIIERLILATLDSQIIQYIKRHSWIFCLDEHGIVHIFDTERSDYRCLIDLKKNADLELTNISVSHDLSTLVLKTNRKTLIVVDLDDYFRINFNVSKYQDKFKYFNLNEPIIEQTLEKKGEEEEEDEDEEEEEEENIESSTAFKVSDLLEDSNKKRLNHMKLLRWFEENDENLMNVLKTEPRWVHKPYITCANSNIDLYENNFTSLNGFSIKGNFDNPIIPLTTSSDNNYGETAKDREEFRRKGVINIPNLIKSIDSVFFTSSKIVITDNQALLDSERKLLCFIDRMNLEEISFASVSSQSLLLTNPRISSLYFINSNELHCILLNLFEKEDYLSKITNNFIMYNEYQLIDKLYERNQWEKKELKIHTLCIGLKYRHIETIENALFGLCEDQQLKGCRILLRFIKHEKRLTVQDESFWLHLLKIGMKFVSTNIEKLASKAAVDKSKYQDIMLFSSHLSQLRKYYNKIKERSDIDNEVVPVVQSPFSVKRAKSRRTIENDFLKISNKGSIMFSGHSIQDDMRSYLVSDGNMTSGTSDIEQKLDVSSEIQVPHSATKIDMIAELEKKIDDMKDVASSYGANKYRWERMSDAEVIVDSLIASNISQAISFLNWRHQQSNKGDLNQQKPLIDLNYVKTIGYHVIYQTICKFQFPLAQKMLYHLGEDVKEHLYRIAWSTSLKKVRDKIINELLSDYNFSEEAKATINFANLISNLFPNPSYSKEVEYHRKMQNKDFEADSEPSTNYSKYPCNDLEDYKPFDERIGSYLDALISEEDKDETNNIGKGYSFFRMTHLDEILKYDKNIPTRIELESIIQQNEDWKSVLENSHDYQSILSYLIRHNDKQKLSYFIQYLLDLHLNENVYYDDDNKLNFKEVGTNEESIKVLMKTFEEENQMLTYFQREFIQDILLKYGLLLPNETSSPMTILSRLSQSGHLFEIKNNELENSTFNKIIPKSHLSPFHSYFFQFTTENNLPFILQEYLKRFELADTREKIERILNDKVLTLNMSTSIRLLINMGSEETLFDASLENAKLIMQSLSSVDVNSMVSSSALQKRPFMALGTLMYAPVSILEAINADKSKPYYIDKKVLEELLKKFPVLKEALFPGTIHKDKKSNNQNALVTKESRFKLESSRNDIDLFYLVSNSSPFSVDQIFKFDTFKSEYISLDDPYFDQYRFEDTLDIQYFLKNGEPFRCYLTIIKEETLNEERKKEIFWQVRNIAFENITNDKILVSCISFLELCKIDCEVLKIDIESAKRIIDDQKAFHVDDILSIQNLFLSMYDLNTYNQNDDVVNKVFDMLINATERLPSNRLNPSVDLSYLQSESSSAAIKWNLLASFTRVHNLPLYERTLVELASSGDWIFFLYYAQILQYPPQQVLGLLSHFKDSNIREHLKISIKSLLKNSRISEPSSQHEPIQNDKYDTNEEMTTSNLLKLVIQCTERVYPGESLLELSLQYKQPFLAVLSLCFPDVTILNCIIAWLSASIKNTDILSGKDSLSIELSKIVSNLTVSSKSTWSISSMSSNAIPAIDSISTLTKFILLLSERKRHEYIIRAFELFEPDHLIIDWLLFVQTFLQNRYDDSKVHLSNYINKMQVNVLSQNSNKIKIGDISWIEYVCSEIADLMIRKQMPTSYERKVFLSLLSEFKLNPKYDLLYHDLVLLKKMDIEPNPNEPFVAPNPEYILQELLNRKMFDDAREYAIRRSLSSNIVTLREAEHLIESIKTKGVWDSYSERTILWSQINNLFLQRKCSPEVASNFFIQRASKISRILQIEELHVDFMPYDDVDDLPRNMTTKDAATEQIFLLSLARQWIDGTHNKTVGHFPKGNVNNVSSGAWKSEKEIQEIDSYILRITVIAQVDVNVPTKRSSFIHKESLKPKSSHSDNESIESMIGQYINDDNISDAERVVEEINHNSKELTIVKNMILIANESFGDVFSVDDINEDVLEMLKKHKNIDLNELTSSTLLTLMSELVTFSKPFCERLLVKYNISKIFSTSYEDIQSKDPYYIISFLIHEGTEHLHLIKQFIKTHYLDSEIIASVLAEECFKSIIELEKNISQRSARDRYSTNSFAEPIALSRTNSSTSLNSISESYMDSFGSIDPSKFDYEQGGQIPHTISYFSAPTTPHKQLKTSQSKIVLPTKGRFWSSKNFPDYLELTDHPWIVGDVLLDILKKSVGISSGVESEVFIRAFISYRVAQDTQRLKELFKRIEQRVPHYVKKKEFKWLVRIITGTKQYGKLQYMLDILVKHDRFDMVLSKNVYSLENDDDRKELRVALHNFLKTHYPTHFDKFKLLFLRFSMHREYADLLQERAWAHLNSMKSKIDPHILLQAMDCFLEASLNYAQDKAYSLERRCLEMVALLQLQFEIPETRITNLKPDQAHLFMQHCSEFSYGLIVSNAYNLNSISDWIEPLYVQVIINGNFNWYEDFRANIYIDEEELFQKVVHRFKNDQQKANNASNFKIFLDYLDDQYLKYKFCKEVEFHDVADNLKNIIGLEYYIALGNKPFL